MCSPSRYSELPGKSLAADKKTSPNEKINLGVIGFGNRCKYVMGGTLPHDDVRCIAIADVWDKHRDSGKAIVDKHYGNSDCETMRDFRELLARDDVDAVLIATGDRWHAAASILAAKAGKDVYSEKPCGITIEDCQNLADTITAEKRVFQAGTQRRSVPNFQKAVELAHSPNKRQLRAVVTLRAAAALVEAFPRCRAAASGARGGIRLTARRKLLAVCDAPRLVAWSRGRAT